MMGKNASIIRRIQLLVVLLTLVLISLSGLSIWQGKQLIKQLDYLSDHTMHQMQRQAMDLSLVSDIENHILSIPAAEAQQLDTLNAELKAQIAQLQQSQTMEVFSPGSLSELLRETE